MNVIKTVIFYLASIFCLNIILIQLNLVSGLKQCIIFNVIGIIFYVLLIKKNRNLMLLAFSLYLNFYILVPVMIERSGSIYLYYLLTTSDKTATQIDAEMFQGYWKGGNFVSSRIKEGIESGLIDCSNDECKLTYMGKIAVKTYKYFSILLVKNPIWAHK